MKLGHNCKFTTHFVSIQMGVDKNELFLATKHTVYILHRISMDNRLCSSTAIPHYLRSENAGNFQNAYMLNCPNNLQTSIITDRRIRYYADHFSVFYHQNFV
jgi:hypothetical protein